MTEEAFNRPLQYLRSGLYALVFLLGMLAFAPVLLLLIPLHIQQRWRVISWWTRFNIAALRWICGVKYRFIGLHNIPRDRSGIAMANHQSTWETFGLFHLFPGQAWVLKRELMYLPIFGWGLALMKPIAIDRGAGRHAMEQLIEQGSRYLEQGRWVFVFPEGTRVKFGERKRYKLGGATLAEHSGAFVLPVAHNAGEFWPRRRFLKRPGTVKVVIGPPIETRGKDAAAISAEAERWIRQAQADIAAGRY